MAQLSVTFRRIDGMRAMLGTAGVKSIVADRPAGVAGGLGLGLSGGELQLLAIGGGYANSLEFGAEKLGIEITGLAIDLRLNVGDDLIESVDMDVRLTVAGGEDDRLRLLTYADENATISRSVAIGFPVNINTN